METLKLKLFLTHWFLVLFAQCNFFVCALNNQTNICDTYGLCSQRCTQKDNTFECSCTKDFQLAPDNRTCNPIDPGWKLIYATDHGIHMIIKGLDGQVGKDTISFMSPNPYWVTYDARNNTVYWTDELADGYAVYKARFTAHNFSDPEVVANAGVSSMGGIAFDWITGNVYFVNPEMSQIVVCGNTTNLCAVVLQNPKDTPRDIALHPNLGIMFWTFYRHLDNTSGIWRAEMDGKSPTRIFSTNIGRPLSVVIDQGNDRLYWADYYLNGKIESCRFDGTDRRVVISQTRRSYGIDILGHQLFWGGQWISQFQCADKFNSTNHEVLVNNFGGGLWVSSIAVVHLANQPIMRDNPCQNRPCSHICALKSNNFRCLCPVGWEMKEDNRSCADNQPKVVVGSRNVLKFIRINAIGKNIFEETEISLLRSIDKLVYNTNSGSLVISDAASGRIIEYSHKRSSVVKVLLNGVRSTAMNIDLVSENLYWVDEEQRSLNVMSLNTGAQLTLRNLTHAGQYRNLLVDSKQRLLYMTRDNEIQEMGLDGTYVRNFTMGLNHLHSMSYDRSSAKIFWLENKNGEVKYGTFGENVSTSFKDSSPVVEFANYENKIYYTTVNSSFLTARLVGIPISKNIPLGSVEEFAKIVILDPNTKYFASLRSQHDCSPGNSNGKNCSHICFPTASPLVGICQCPTYFFLNSDNRTCVSDSLLLPLECNKNHFRENCEKTTHIIWVSIIIFATIFGYACIGFWCARNKNRFQTFLVTYTK